MSVGLQFGPKINAQKYHLLCSWMKMLFMGFLKGLRRKGSKVIWPRSQFLSKLKETWSPNPEQERSGGG